MTHTPGPWLIEEGEYTGNNWLVGTLFVGNDRETGDDIFVHITTDHIHASQLGYTRALDDARLIAAAPQLLEALRGLCTVYELWDKLPVDDFITAYAKAQAAIAAAEGSDQ